jgi:uncharacterized membrane protein (UPF0127 family)
VSESENQLLPENIRVVNATKSTELAARCVVASSHKERMVGLLNRSGLEEGEALLIEACAAIHMIGMRFSIDVVFLDTKRRVLKTVENVRPWTPLVSCSGADSALELPTGAIARTKTQPGDQLLFSPQEPPR